MGSVVFLKYYFQKEVNSKFAGGIFGGKAMEYLQLTQNSSVAYWCDFNCFVTTMELECTEE